MKRRKERAPVGSYWRVSCTLGLGNEVTRAVNKCSAIGNCLKHKTRAPLVSSH